MAKNISFELIVTIVDRGNADFVVEATRSAGASGGTIIYGRGSGIHEKDRLLGVAIQPEKEVVLTLVKKAEKKQIMQSILDNTNITEAGKGICFCLPVLNVAGINHELQKKKGKDVLEEEN